ncbi:MAG: molybdate ABC transporter substrate-binding protein [Acidimicrobiia bacterium]|nr:molybdate ABC transporter substrate-binding protein [Acidimicrobiia bacterium]
MQKLTKALFAVLAGLSLVALSLFSAACGSDDNAAPTTSTTSAGSTLEGGITVSAAASLTDAFTEIGDDFHAANPDVEVTFNFDSSATLATQIIEGAPVDVYASADEANMTKLTDQNLVAGEAEVFARNELVIITKPGNPQDIKTLADLADAGVISLCGQDVPCGKYSAQALEKAGVSIPESSVTRGQHVGATLTAVSEGDAVAGIVYVSDAKTAGDAVASVSIPTDANVIATYPIGAIAASQHLEIAEAFKAYVLGEDGQAVLAEFGFLPPA